MKNILAGIILIVGWGMIANTPVFAAPLAKPAVENRPIEVVVNGEFIKLDIGPPSSFRSHPCPCITWTFL